MLLGPGIFPWISIYFEPSLFIAHTYLLLPEPPIYLRQILPSFSINKSPELIISPASYLASFALLVEGPSLTFKLFTRTLDILNKFNNFFNVNHIL